jgi:hypothetical protein
MDFYTMLGAALRQEDDRKKTPRLCRVLQGFEPAFAGGLVLRNAALAQAYRVISSKSETV